MLGHIQMITLLPLFFLAINTLLPPCPPTPHTSCHYCDEAGQELLFLKCHLNSLEIRGQIPLKINKTWGIRTVNWDPLWQISPLIKEFKRVIYHVKEFGLCCLEVKILQSFEVGLWHDWMLTNLLRYLPALELPSPSHSHQLKHPLIWETVFTIETL